jgi:hypothetical protein
MFRRFISLALAALIAVPLTQLQAIAADSPFDLNAEKEARFVEKVKAGVAKLGVGPDARVKVKLKDKTKIEGYVSEIGDEGFNVTDLKTGTTTIVAYPTVAQVQGNNLSTRTKIIIAAAIITGVVITLYLVRGAFCDGC